MTCPICGRNTDRDIPDSMFPELCGKCVKKERALRAKRKDGRTIEVDQRSLF